MASEIETWQKKIRKEIVDLDIGITATECVLATLESRLRACDSDIESYNMTYCTGKNMFAVFQIVFEDRIPHTLASLQTRMGGYQGTVQSSDNISSDLSSLLDRIAHRFSQLMFRYEYLKVFMGRYEGTSTWDTIKRRLKVDPETLGSVLSHRYGLLHYDIYSTKEIIFRLHAYFKRIMCGSIGEINLLTLYCFRCHEQLSQDMSSLENMIEKEGVKYLRPDDVGLLKENMCDLRADLEQVKREYGMMERDLRRL